MIKALIGIALALVATIATQLSSPRYAYACTCAPPPNDTNGHFRVSDAVFVGEAVGVERSSNLPVKATVSVGAVYKGEVDRTTVVQTSATSDDCGIDFVPGTQYAFFAAREDDGWVATSCSTRQDVGALSAAGYNPEREYGEEMAVDTDLPRAASPIPPPDPAGRTGPIAAAGVMMATAGATLLVALRARANRATG
jgi:hypothetical protein